MKNTLKVFLGLSLVLLPLFLASIPGGAAAQSPNSGAPSSAGEGTQPGGLQPDSSSDRYVVGGVAVEGNKRIDTTAIKTAIKARPGSVVSDVVSDDVKTLYNMGFFDQVTASLGAAPNGQRTLRYVVVEKPIVRKVFIKGNKKVKEGELKDIIKFDSHRFLDTAKVQQLMRAATSYYQTQGFLDAKFEYSVVPVGENQVDLTFTVEEGKRYRIRSVEIRGLSKLDEGEILSVIQTKRYKWYSSWLFGTGRLNQEMLENDKSLMRQFFLDHGFIDGTVGDPTIDKRPDGIYLIFDVNEGPEYRIGTVSASGDLLKGGSAETLDGISTKSGSIFNASVLRDDTFKISDKYSDIGYAFVNVVPDTGINRNVAKVNVNFVVNRGNVVTVNRINIHGNQKTYDNVVRRELKIDEQDVYSSSKVKRSQKLLERLGYFEEVNITTQPVDDKDSKLAPGSPTPVAGEKKDLTKKDKVDLDVNVREGSTGTFSAGAGFSSSDGILFNSRLSENNIFGTGRSASINADIGSQRDSVTVSYDDRRFDDTNLALGTDLFRTERDYQDFHRILTGGSITAGYPLEEIFGEALQDVNFSTSYQYLDIDIKGIDLSNAAALVVASEGRSTASSITPKLVHSTINNPINPTEGSLQSVSMELAGLGGTEKYYLLEGRQNWYVPVSKTEHGDLTFAWRTSVGYGRTFDGDPFPLFKRYFPGGINSVRGYKARSLGPKDIDGHEFGGSKELVNNLELIFPLFNSVGLKGLVFYDTGQAYDDRESIDLGKLRQAAGFGIRWTSPLGPIRIEFGIPIDRKSGERHFVTLFSFGAPI